MPPGAQVLTDTAAKQAKPKEKPYRLSDEKGLYLEVQNGGSKYWRMKYRYGGKEKRLAFGVYPDVSLKRAREKRADARELLADGIRSPHFSEPRVESNVWAIRRMFAGAGCSIRDLFLYTC